MYHQGTFEAYNKSNLGTNVASSRSQPSPGNKLELAHCKKKTGNRLFVRNLCFIVWRFLPHHGKHICFVEQRVLSQTPPPHLQHRRLLLLTIMPKHPWQSRWRQHDGNRSLTNHSNHDSNVKNTTLQLRLQEWVSHDGFGSVGLFRLSLNLSALSGSNFV